ncbi:MAG TPA: phosphoribosylanthranilate isomerase [Burkholderiales bacterium]|nr:phosphoribosylanthranilate isomerase [Burkholderiales bacterium]
MRTRVKICGITSAAVGLAAARHGADAIGLIFYAPSPRLVTLERAREIASSVPAFVARVAVFVNPAASDVAAVIRACRPDLLQFHGEEAADFCRGFGVPYLRALRVRPGVDLLESLSSFNDAAGWLLDAYRQELYGGTGEAFDWNLIPPGLPRPLILSGGLDAENVGAAIRRVRPWAVDVSSGVEVAKGVKDERRIAAFMEAVRNADV